jgi:hypothetical protein
VFGKANGSTKYDYNVLMLFLLWISALEWNRITTLTITHINIWNLSGEGLGYYSTWKAQIREA